MTFWSGERKKQKTPFSVSEDHFLKEILFKKIKSYSALPVVSVDCPWGPGRLGNAGCLSTGI